MQMIFRFKQFNIQQRASAAKITTDATIFAAWLPVSNVARSALEIGAGTGVLSLMLAQRFPELSITAVEIDEKAFAEARQNFEQSPFAARLSIAHTSIQQFKPDVLFDVIFSNPPFFTNNLQSVSNKARNTAYHTNKLNFEELAISIEVNLATAGSAFIMLPIYESRLMEAEMNRRGFALHQSLLIKHNQVKNPLRKINEFKRAETKHPQVQSIVIRDADGSFSEAYSRLLAPFLTIF